MMGGANGHPYIVFAGGGSGGHLYPLLSIADEIRLRMPGVRFGFWTTQRNTDERMMGRAFQGVSQAPVCGRADPEIVVQRVMPLPTSLRRLPQFIASWRASVRSCRERFMLDAPDVVIGGGGYGSAPPIWAARRLRIPGVLLNPDAVPGRANRFLASKARVVFVQWPVTKSHLSRRVPVEVVGCPVRRQFQNAGKADGWRRFGLDPSRKTLLVTGASQGAHSINRAIAALVDALVGIDGWQFLHLTGQADVALVREAYRARPLRTSVLAYTEHMAEALAVADLVLSRAGASTLAEITAVGVASVLMPYPHHGDRHQYANASVLADAGAAVIVEDRIRPDENAGPLSNVLHRLMGDTDALEVMAGRAAELGTTNAAATIADRVLMLAGRGRNVTRKTRSSLSASEEWRDLARRDDDENIEAVCPSDGVVSMTGSR